MDQNFPEGHPRKIVIQGRPESCRRASTMVSELINGEPGSAQAIIQRVCQEVSALLCFALAPLQRAAGTVPQDACGVEETREQKAARET